jgi:4-amino-4-deoxy-L-arabinose transferase-like glycosyltransferase
MDADQRVCAAAAEGERLSSDSRFRTDALLLVGFCGFLFFFGLAYFGLIGADEPRYAQVAREMLARHDWITPTLGGQPWMEKPPLYYWQAMLAYAVFGVSDWAARLPSAIDASLMVIGIYFFLRRFRPGFEIDGALMTASAAGVIGFARAASTDMPLAATFALALLAWYAWYESQSKIYLAFAYALLALGMLAKGPVAPFLALAVVAVFALAKGDARLILRTLWLPGILFFCVVGLPWYIAVQLKNHDFFRIFILEHNLARFGTNLYRHKEPFWYYIPVVLAGLVPWTVFVVAALIENCRAWCAEGREMLRAEDSLNVFLILWLAVPVIFFSLSQSKLPGYIVPALPAATLLLVQYLRHHAAGNDRPGKLVIALHSIVCAAPLLPALTIAYIVSQHHLSWNRATATAVTIAGMLAVAVFLTLSTRLGLGALRFVTLVPVVLSVAAVLRLGAPTLDNSMSARPIAREISGLETRPLPTAVFGVSREMEFGLAFYRNQVIARYAHDPIPSGEHFVVATHGSQVEVAKRVSPRRVSYLGNFAAQGIDYYWVAGKQ